MTAPERPAAARLIPARPVLPRAAELLRAVELTKSFQTDGGAVQAIRGIDLSIRRGEFVAVMGPSGSGKSTLLQLLGGLESATSGQIWLDGQRVDGLSQTRWAVLRRRHIGFVFQFFNLVSTMTVADNVELAALLAGATRRSAHERREELLAELGLSSEGRPHPEPAVRWRAAASGAGPGAGPPAEPAAGRRANRQPGQCQHHGGAAPARADPCPGPDDSARHPRRAGRWRGRPGRSPLRWHDLRRHRSARRPALAARRRSVLELHG